MLRQRMGKRLTFTLEINKDNIFSKYNHCTKFGKHQASGVRYCVINMRQKNEI